MIQYFIGIQLQRLSQWPQFILLSSNMQLFYFCKWWASSTLPILKYHTDLQRFPINKTCGLPCVMHIIFMAKYKVHALSTNITDDIRSDLIMFYYMLCFSPCQKLFFLSGHWLPCSSGCKPHIIRTRHDQKIVSNAFFANGNIDTYEGKELVLVCIQH